ncbi:hypothetical protein [Oceanobacillus profundus]|uniref:hypothetical protein n=1 Tax=Oceanobacillus TaxID=182709 RepID=UPI0026E43A25|nr:hypothetical protein [Oceanobacillus profundus]MDO6448076.1 hypothetical protein [Oceanobacillus profundus]
MKKVKTIDVALYIFILTGLGYFVTFSYGWGYNNYFSIPIHFIDFSIFNITKSISLLGIGISTLLVFFIYFLDKTDINWLFNKVTVNMLGPKSNYFFQLLCLVGLITVVVMARKESNAQFVICYLYIGLFFCLLYFYLKKYLKAAFVTIVIVFLMLPYILGVTNAKNQTDFFIIDSYKDYLIITFSNDKIIAAKFDSESNTISPEFKILPIDILEESNNDLSLIKINKPFIAEPNKSD